jgi:hypothetical protein
MPNYLDSSTFKNYQNNTAQSKAPVVPTPGAPVAPAGPGGPATNTTLCPASTVLTAVLPESTTVIKGSVVKGIAAATVLILVKVCARGLTRRVPVSTPRATTVVRLVGSLIAVTSSLRFVMAILYLTSQDPPVENSQLIQNDQG